MTAIVNSSRAAYSRFWKFLGFGIVLATSVKWFRFWLGYLSYLRQLKRLQEKFPWDKESVGAGIRFLLGYFPKFAQNSHRIPEYRSEWFRNVRQETGRKLQTIQVVAPCWRQQVIMLTIDPKIVRHILKDGFDSWIKLRHIQRCTKDIFGEGMFVLNHGSTSPDHEEWSFQRKVASRVFTRSSFTGHVYNVLIKNADKMLRNIEQVIVDNGEFEAQKQVQNYTLDSIAEIGCGVQLNCLDSEEEVEFSKAFDEVSVGILGRMIFPFRQHLWWLSPNERLLRKNKKICHDLCYRVIAEKRRDPNLSESKDVLSLFMQSESNLSDSVLKDFVFGMFVAGRDTTSATLSFAFYLLATHQEVQQEVFEEISSVLKEKHKFRRVTFEALKQMPLLDAIVFETLRLFPPATADGKQAAREDILPDGTVVPEGTQIMFDIL